MKRLLLLSCLVFSLNLKAQEIDFTEYDYNKNQIFNSETFTDRYHPFSPLNIINNFNTKELKIKSIKEFILDSTKKEKCVNTIRFDTNGFITHFNQYKFKFDTLKNKYITKDTSSFISDYSIIDGKMRLKYYNYIACRIPFSSFYDKIEIQRKINSKKEKILFFYNTEIIYKGYCFEEIDTQIEDTNAGFIERLEYYIDNKLIQTNILRIEKY
jgi:hypothetical protein